MAAIYAAMRDRLLVVTGEPGDWQSTVRLEGRDLECADASKDAPDRVFCGTFESGLHRSTDGGDSWERVGEREIESDAVMSVAVDPRDPDVAWAGTEPSAVYRSTDGGATWESVPGITDLPSADEWYFPPRPHTHHVRWIEPDPDVEDRLYVGIEAGAFVITEDGGETWRERPPGARRDNHTLATHPDAPGRVYAAAGDGYAESTDGGESFEHPQDGLDHRYVWGLAVDPGDPDTVLVSAASGASAAHRRGEAYVYRRRGSGPWERIGTDGPSGDGLPTGTGVFRAVLAPGTASGELYAVHNRGIYRTGDAGTSWSRLRVDWPAALESQAPRGLAVVA